MAQDQLTEDTPLVGRFTRRTFNKWAAAVGATAALATVPGVFATSTAPGRASQAVADGLPDAEKTVWNACIVNCGSRCPLRVQVKDGKVARLLPDNTGDNSLLNRNITACVRGRNMRERLYSPDRIKYPMKRKAGTKRGDGQWERISWDEAAQMFADKHAAIMKQYGPEAILRIYGSGVWNAHINYGVFNRLLNVMGGALKYHGNYSYGQLNDLNKYHYGFYGESPSNSIEDSITNGRMLVLWGNNPLETRMSGGGVLFTALQAAKTKNLKVVVIDPMYSDTAAVIADEWIAPRPGSDAAFVAAIVHVLLKNNLHDQNFLDTYCVGFDEEHMPEGVPAGQSYRAYVEGKGPDGVEKTPAWASRITGIPASQIEEFALELGRTKPVNITQGWGIQRQANGEASTKAIYTLAAVLGQIGIPGGGNGGRDGYFWPLSVDLPTGTNSVKASIPFSGWSEAIKHGHDFTPEKDGLRGAEKLSTDVKFIVVQGSNMLASQHPNINATRELIQDESKCEFVCVIDNQMTRTADLADLILPDTTTFERWDLAPSEYTGDMAYLIVCEPAVDPLWESKPGYDICALIAEKAGKKEAYTEGRTLEQWTRHLYAEARKEIPSLPESFDDFRKLGVHRYTDPEGLFVAEKKFRQDPVANKLKTPSGKIEIFSKELFELQQHWTFTDKKKGDVLSPIGAFIETWEGPLEAQEHGKYPIQLIGHHYKGRAHSTYGNLPKNREAHPQMLFLNTADAKARGIANGDTVEIFNDRGRVQVPVRVTPRVRPGVASLPQGGWLVRGADGVDTGGANNTLTSSHRTPLSRGNAQHTNLVEVKLVKKAGN